MKKIFIFLLAVLLCAGGLQAQIFKCASTGAQALFDVSTSAIEPRKNTEGVSPRTVELGDKERIMAYFDSEDISDNGGGLNVNMIVKAGVLMDGSVIDAFRGNKITRIRFGLAANIVNSAVFVYPVNGNGEIGEALCEQSVESGMKGWNDIKLDKPVTIPADVTGLLIGYQYKQNRNAYPVGMNEKGAGMNVSYMYFNNGTQGENWYDVGLGSVGILCIQAVVEMDNLPEREVVLGDVSLEKMWYRTGETFNVSGTLKNYGATLPKAYTLEMLCGGKVFATVDTPVALTNAPQKFTLSGTMPEELAIDKQTFSLRVKDIDGVAAAKTYEQTTTFNAYANHIPRQMFLVEQFTAQRCTNCPMGEGLLSTLTRAHDDVAWVAVHCKGMGADFFNYTDCDYIENIIQPEGYPSASFNRLASDGNLYRIIGYQESMHAAMAESLYKVMQRFSAPAFVALDVKTSLDGDVLTVKVDGYAKDEALRNYYGGDGKDPVVVVYLTEDKLNASQLSPSGIIDFEHNNVLRATMGNAAGTNVYGTPVAWNGNGFSNEFTTKLDAKWNVDNMNVVVFVARNSSVWNNPDKADVNNCVKVKLGESTTGIGHITPDAEAYEVARYTMDGRRVTAPAKGLNIVKMSDGTTKKVWVN